MNIIYNGEIYLKRGPEIIDPRNSIEYQELEDTISDIEFELSKENPDLSKAEYLEPLQAYKDILDSKKVSQIIQEQIVFGNYIQMMVNI